MSLAPSYFYRKSTFCSFSHYQLAMLKTLFEKSYVLFSPSQPTQYCLRPTVAHKSPVGIRGLRLYFPRGPSVDSKLYTHTLLNWQVCATLMMYFSNIKFYLHDLKKNSERCELRFKFPIVCPRRYIKISRFGFLGRYRTYLLIGCGF